MNNRKDAWTRAAYLALILAGFMLISFMPGTAAGADDIRVFVDGQEIDYGDSPPMVINERVMVGIRSLALALGVPEDGILWDGTAQTVMLIKDKTVIVLAIDNYNMLVNDSYVQMDTTPAVNNERIYLPARYVSEALGYQVSWDGASNAVQISSTGTPPVNNSNNSNDNNNANNHNNVANSDAESLIGGWSNLSQSSTGSMVDPATGFANGTYFSGEWYYFNADGTSRYVIIGQGSVISGLSEVRSNYSVAGDRITFTNQVQDFTPFPQDIISLPSHSEPIDDETHTFVYNSSSDTLTLDGWNAFNRIQ